MSTNPKTQEEDMATNVKLDSDQKMQKQNQTKKCNSTFRTRKANSQNITAHDYKTQNSTVNLEMQQQIKMQAKDTVNLNTRQQAENTTAKQKHNSKSKKTIIKMEKAFLMLAADWTLIMTMIS